MKALKNRVVALSFFVFAIFIAPATALAHCDTLDGPVVGSARVALAKNDITPVLKWVGKDAEAEVTTASEIPEENPLEEETVPTDEKPADEKPAAPELTWEQQVEGKADDAFVAYALSTRFEKGQLVTHVKFGKGVVVDVEPSRVEILFQDGKKKLGHGAS